MHYPKNLRESTAALVECCQLIGGYVGHYGRLERSHPLFTSLRDLTSTVALHQYYLFDKHRIKDKTDKELLSKIKKVESSLQKVLKGSRKR
jgi:hypothetical protein